jgi:chemotaxis protein MotA
MSELKFSFGTLIGILLSLSLLILAISGEAGDLSMFFQWRSFALVFGGTIAATMISYNGRYVVRALREIPLIFVPSFVSRESLRRDVAELIKWGKITKGKGVVALEEYFNMNVRNKNPSPFLEFFTQIVLENYRPEVIYSILKNAINSQFERNMVAARILKNMSGIAPAFGIIGSLVGMIIVLRSMGGDVSQLGVGFSVAFLSTLYGISLAQLVFKPAALKKEQKEEMERFRNNVLLEGMAALLEQCNELELEDRLNSLLDFSHPSNSRSQR